MTLGYKSTDAISNIFRGDDTVNDKRRVAVSLEDEDSNPYSDSNPFHVFNSDFRLEVARGNVDGVSPLRITGLNLAISATFQDLWCPCGTMIYPTTGETWEVVSDSANDTLFGTGAREIEIISMDDDYNIQETFTVELNGTTPVTVSGTHFRHIFSRVSSFGITGWNEGTINIRQVGTEYCRSCIIYDTENSIGMNTSQDSHYTVPAGKTLYLTDFFINATKDHDITSRVVYRLFGEGGFLTKTNLGTYQNTFAFNYTSIVHIFEEKTDIKIIAKSNNTAVTVTSGMGCYLVDN